MEGIDGFDLGLVCLCVVALIGSAAGWMRAAAERDARVRAEAENVRVRTCPRCESLRLVLTDAREQRRHLSDARAHLSAAMVAINRADGAQGED